MIATDARDLERFRTGVARWFGLHFDETRTVMLHDAFTRRLHKTGLGGAAYLDRLESANETSGELRELARELTVGETYFYRNIDQFTALAETVLPERMAARARGHTRALSLLSAGCASGEEAYSLAMVVRDRLREPDWNVSILGVDLNPAALEKAAGARYSSWSLRELPDEVRQRWFREQGRELVLDRAIRAAVRFEERNLADPAAGAWGTEIHDVVFCRNVLMYFTPEVARAALKRLTRALVPGGYLFLGHAETLRGLSNDFHLCHTHGTFYYRRKDTLADDHPGEAEPWTPGPAAVRSPLLPSATTDSAPPAGAVEASPSDWPVAGGWMEAIRQASARIATLTTAAAGPSGAPGVPGGARARPDLTTALNLLSQERYGEALALLHALPLDAARDPDTLLLQAVLLIHRGSLAQAETTCAELLTADEMNAGAHYLLALCREGAGDPRGAAGHDQIAAYLDPAFAMPHLHAGMLARREGDHETARRELGQALPLLLREEAARLLMFGGGFTRPALVTLCRAELAAAGGTP